MDIPRALATTLEALKIDADDHLASQARTTPTAFATLYERHVERVFRFLRARGAPEEVASDLTATTFERALVNIDRYRPGPAGFAPWLLRIARNAYIDAGRRARLTIQLSDADHLAAVGPSPEDAAIAAEERRWLLGLLATLPDLQRDAIALRFGAGLSSREIGQVIGKSEDATKKLLTRALAALKESTRHDD
jgi:RNA polymerase sigma-70 factor (ECF subfamily)